METNWFNLILQQGVEINSEHTQWSCNELSNDLKLLLVCVYILPPNDNSLIPDVNLSLALSIEPKIWFQNLCVLSKFSIQTFNFTPIK